MLGFFVSKMIYCWAFKWKHLRYMYIYYFWVPYHTVCAHCQHYMTSDLCVHVLCTCISMCLGLSIYFSMSSLSSPKLDAASWDENRKPSLQPHARTRRQKHETKNNCNCYKDWKYQFALHTLYWSWRCKQKEGIRYLVSSSFQEILIPFPPPPAEALIITG